MNRILPTFGLVSFVVLGGCMQDAMLAVNPNQTIALMEGNGSVSRAPTGETTFRFIIQANVYNGIIDDPDLLRDQHDFLISKWVGEQGICEDGYTVDKRTEMPGGFPVGPMLIYEGKCA